MKTVRTHNSKPLYAPEKHSCHSASYAECRPGDVIQISDSDGYAAALGFAASTLHRVLAFCCAIPRRDTAVKPARHSAPVYQG